MYLIWHRAPGGDRRFKRGEPTFLAVADWEAGLCSSESARQSKVFGALRCISRVLKRAKLQLCPAEVRRILEYEIVAIPYLDM